MVYSLLHFADPPNTYAMVGGYPTEDAALGWLNAHLHGDFVVFNNPTLKDTPEHHVRMDQWVLMNTKGEASRLGTSAGKFVIKVDP